MCAPSVYSSNFTTCGLAVNCFDNSVFGEYLKDGLLAGLQQNFHEIRYEISTNIHFTICHCFHDFFGKFVSLIV